LLNGVEHANPIILSLPKEETRATEYSKAATRGNWNEVWDNFDRRKAAKAANDAPEAEGDADMFARAGVAAE
jgi:ribonucleoside-diphosphate reductase beta chain